jgi:hypothetical protein
MQVKTKDILWALGAFLFGLLLVRVTSPARVMLTWETASEVDAAGFHVYRSASAESTFERVTSALIPTKGDPLTGASYSYEDSDVRWGQRYYYQLEEVTLNGGTNRYPEIVQSRAGLGWGWASGIALGMAVLSLLSALWPARSRASSEETVPAGEISPS